MNSKDTKALGGSSAMVGTAHGTISQSLSDALRHAMYPDPYQLGAWAERAAYMEKRLQSQSADLERIVHEYDALNAQLKALEARDVANKAQPEITELALQQLIHVINTGEWLQHAELRGVVASLGADHVYKNSNS